MEAALRLIRGQYSWFLSTFEGYNSVVAKGELQKANIDRSYFGTSLLVSEHA